MLVFLYTLCACIYVHKTVVIFKRSDVLYAKSDARFMSYVFCVIKRGSRTKEYDREYTAK